MEKEKGKTGIPDSKSKIPIQKSEAELFHQIANDVEDIAGNVGTTVDSFSDLIFDICTKFPDWQLDVVNALLTIAVRTAYIPDLIDQIADVRRGQEKLGEKLNDIYDVLGEVKRTLQFPDLYVLHSDEEKMKPRPKYKPRKAKPKLEATL